MAELIVKRALKMLCKLVQLSNIGEDAVFLLSLEMSQVLSNKGPVYIPLDRFNPKGIKAH